MPLFLDAFIILIYFAGIIALGLYMGRRENTLHDFALGGRRVPWWAVMASIIAAETSAATFIGTPGEVVDEEVRMLAVEAVHQRLEEPPFVAGPAGP